MFAIMKVRLTVFTALRLVLAAGFPLHSVHAQTIENEFNESVEIALENVDIHAFIEMVSKHTGKNFIVDPRVNAKVRIISTDTVTADQLYDMFLSVLEVHGYAAVPSGNFIKIVPTSVGVQSAVPLVFEQRNNNRIIHDDDLVSHVLRIEGAPVQPLIQVLRPVMPASAIISAEVSSNSLIITDRAANLARVVNMVRLIVSAN